MAACEGLKQARYVDRRVAIGWLVGWVWFGLVWFGWVGLGWVGLGWVGWLVYLAGESSCFEGQHQLVVPFGGEGSEDTNLDLPKRTLA